MKRMALFEFELMPVEDIKPWGEAGKESLGCYEPDMPWNETETALRTLAEKSGVHF